MKQWNCVLVCLIASGVISLHAKIYQIASPDGYLKTEIRVDDHISFSVFAGNQHIITASEIALDITEHGDLGKEPQVTDVNSSFTDSVLYPVVPVKRYRIIEKYHELTLHFTDDWQIQFRAYNEGVVYRFITQFPGRIRVKNERMTFRFPENPVVFFPTETSFVSHFECYYERGKLSTISKGDMCSLPVFTGSPSGPKVVFTESDLVDYPGLFLEKKDTLSLAGLIPGKVLSVKPGPKPEQDEIVTQRADYIAETTGARNFPWRVFMVGKTDKDILNNELVYQLASPCRISKTSWIKPGKVAWDWWNANNIYGVPFRAGINTETYQYYIDFASQYGLEYVILDAGWSPLTNVTEVVPEINMTQLCKYAKEKNVGLILWVLWKPLDEKLEEALDLYAQWGIKGIKVDFMQRDDQWMVNYYHRAAKACAERELLVDFHGAYKPAGLRRMYPNVITREGVRGLEQSKWNDLNTPEHNVILPFIRMVAGPMDYTPGAMINAQKENFHPVFTRPMSMGTRCHQLAMYVIYESPLQMLCDSPSNYLQETECMHFLSAVPPVWDETVVLHGKIGDYVAVARQSGDDWYAGAMTDWNARDLTIDCSFLPSENYKATIYQDGINADRYASDYQLLTRDIQSGDKLYIHLAPGGGWAARFVRM